MSELSRDVLVEKKFDFYGNEKLLNFKLNSELTVEITLNEYRDLISAVAVAEHKVSKAEADKWTRESENSKLKDENKELRAEINRYIVEFGRLPIEEDDEDE